jgi:hypothetical protein
MGGENPGRLPIERAQITSELPVDRGDAVLKHGATLTSRGRNCRCVERE